MGGVARVVILLSCFAICAVQGIVLAGREQVHKVVVDGPSARPMSPPVALGAPGLALASASGGGFLMERMTHDDIARGVWALAEEPAESEIGLSPAQVSGLQGHARDGLRLRVEMESLRAHAAVHRNKRLVLMAEVARLLGPQRVGALEGRR